MEFFNEQSDTTDIVDPTSDIVMEDLVNTESLIDSAQTNEDSTIDKFLEETGTSSIGEGFVLLPESDSPELEGSDQVQKENADNNPDSSMSETEQISNNEDSNPAESSINNEDATISESKLSEDSEVVGVDDLSSSEVILPPWGVIPFENKKLIISDMEVNQFISTSIPEHLNELVLMNVTFTEQGLLGLRDTLKVLPLSSLGISSPHISRNMIDVLSPGLINSTMESFFLKSDDIPNKAIRLLSTKLRQHPYLVHLSLAQSIVDDEGVRALKFLIDEKSTLEELDLDSNTITDDGFSFLLEGLKNNEFLVSISIANNDISDDGIISLVQFLHTNTTLLSLNLNNNKITDVGITLLAKALEQNPSLRQIRLTNNSISNFGAEVLCSFLKKNRTLMELYIAEGNDINEDGIKGCLEQLKYNGFLEKTDLHPDVTLVDNVEFNEKRNEKASTFFQSVPPLIKLIPQIGKPAVELTAQYLLLDKSNDIEYFNESERLTLIHGCINEENYQYIKAELHDVTAWSLLTRCQKLLRDVAKIEGQDEVSDQEYEIEDILNSRISKNKRKLEYLIKWDGYPIEDATWQNYEFLENSQMLIDEFHEKNPDKPNPGMLVKTQKKTDRQPLAILDCHVARNKNHSKFLVHWEGQTEEEATWELAKNVSNGAKLIENYKKEHPDRFERKPKQKSPAETLKPVKILDFRPTKNKVHRKYLVEWEGLSADKATWENVKKLDKAKDLIEQFHKDHPEKSETSTVAKRVPKGKIVETILNSRVSLNGDKLEYLIQWEGYPADYSTWENSKSLRITEEAKAKFHEKYPEKPDRNSVVIISPRPKQAPANKRRIETSEELRSPAKRNRVSFETLEKDVDSAKKVAKPRTSPLKKRKVKKDDSNTLYEIEAVVDSRYTKADGLEYCVLWKGYSWADRTWISVDNLKEAKDMVTLFHVEHPNAVSGPPIEPVVTSPKRRAVKENNAEKSEDEDDEVWEIEDIIDSRYTKNNGLEYCVLWKGHGYNDRSWLFKRELKGCPFLIKAFHKKNPNKPTEPVHSSPKKSKEYEIEDIIDSKYTKSKGLEYCVLWKGYPYKDRSWIPKESVVDADFLLNAFHNAYPGKPSGPPQMKTRRSTSGKRGHAEGYEEDELTKPAATTRSTRQTRNSKSPLKRPLSPVKRPRPAPAAPTTVSRKKRADVKDFFDLDDDINDEIDNMILDLPVEVDDSDDNIDTHDDIIGTPVHETKEDSEAEKSKEEESGEDDDEQFEIESILDSRLSKVNGLEYMILWKGYSRDDCTWIPASDTTSASRLVNIFHRSYPDKPSGDRMMRPKGVTPKEEPILVKSKPSNSASKVLPKKRAIRELSPKPLSPRVTRRTTSSPPVKTKVVPQKQTKKAKKSSTIKEKSNSSSAETEVYVVEKILDTRTTKQGLQFKIRWRGYSAADDSWEPAASINAPLLIAEFYENDRRKSKSSRKEESSDEEVEPYKITDSRYFGKNKVLQYYVKFDGGSEEWIAAKYLPNEAQDAIVEFHEEYPDKPN